MQCVWKDDPHRPSPNTHTHTESPLVLHASRSIHKIVKHNVRVFIIFVIKVREEKKK